MALAFLFALSVTVGATAVSAQPAGDEMGLERESIFLDEPERKDPFVAGVLSWSWNGLGQFYTQNYTRGSLFLMTNVLQTGILIYGVLYYSDKYQPDDNDVVKWEDVSARDKGIMIGYIFSILLVKVLGVIDAVNSAETYNREVYFPYWKNRTRLRLSMEAEKDRIEFSMIRNLSF